MIYFLHVGQFGRSLWCRDTIVLPELTEGAELKLHLISAFPVPSERSNEAGVEVVAKIVHAYRPFTMSPVLRVSISSLQALAHIPDDAVLKLYDRRCLTNTRERRGEGHPWDLHKEREYRRYLAAVAEGSTVPLDFEEPKSGRKLSDGEFEAYLRYIADKMFQTEGATYDRLLPLQGNDIPRCFASVEWEVRIPLEGDTAVTETVHGLLLEHIPGLSLRDLVRTWTRRQPALPSSVLADLCDRAVAVIDHTSNFDVLNEDVRMDNFIVREPFFRSPPPADAHSAREHELIDHPVILLDLAQVRLRASYLTDAEWGLGKLHEDEEGAVGYILLRLLKKFVGEGVWTYQPSDRWLEFEDDTVTSYRI